MIYGDFFKDAILVNVERHPVMEELSKLFHGPVQMALHGLTSAPFWLAASGVALSYYMYIVNPALPAAVQRRFQPVYVLLDNKYYLDWFNENILARGIRALGTRFWKTGDQKIIDGFFVDGSWRLVSWISSRVRKVQSGYIYHYAFGMIIGVFVLMTYFVLLNQ